MAININRILNKKKWKGAEAGKLFLLSLVHNTRIAREGKDYTPLISQEELNKVTSSLSGREYEIYRVYFALYEALYDRANWVEAMRQQGFHGSDKLSSMLQETLTLDTAATEGKLSHPVIMTDKQYNNLLKGAKKDKEKMECCYLFLLGMTIEEALNEDRVCSPSVRDEILSIAEEPCTNEKLQQLYKDFRLTGYYKLPDGRTSKDMDTEAWENAISLLDQRTPVEKKADKNEILKMFFYGVDELLRVYGNLTNSEVFAEEDQKQEIFKLFTSLVEGLGFWSIYLKDGCVPYYGNVRPSSVEVVLKVVSHYLNGYSITWHNEEVDTSKLTKGEALELLINGEANYEYLAEEFPSVLAAAHEHLVKLFPVFGEAPNGTIPEQIIPFKELVKRKLFNANQMLEVDDFDIADFYTQYYNLEEEDAYYYRKRIIKKGIAIITQNSPSTVDKKGNYIEDKSIFASAPTLEEKSNSKFFRNRVVDYREELLKPSLAFMYAYNALIDIIAEVYDIEELKETKQDTSICENTVSSYNQMLYDFYFTMDGSQEEKERNRAILKALFPPINIQNYQPLPLRVDEIRLHIQTLGLNSRAVQEYSTLTPFINKLMDRNV